jgi:hypothetical protein
MICEYCAKKKGWVRKHWPNDEVCTMDVAWRCDVCNRCTDGVLNEDYYVKPKDTNDSNS